MTGQYLSLYLYVSLCLSLMTGECVYLYVSFCLSLMIGECVSLYLYVS